MPGTDPPRPTRGCPTSAAISNVTVRLLSQCTGRGPTKARTFRNDALGSDETVPQLADPREAGFAAGSAGVSGR
jgi:hypothetical protein